MVSLLVRYGHDYEDIIDGYPFPRVNIQYYMASVEEIRKNILFLLERQVDEQGAKTIKQDIRKLEMNIRKLEDEIENIQNPNVPVKPKKNINDNLRGALSNLAGAVAIKNNDLKKPPQKSKRPKKIGPKLKSDGTKSKEDIVGKK